jgi:hypothetical protein
MKYLNIDRIIEVDTIEQLFVNLFAFSNTPENSPLIFKHLRQTPPEEIEINREIWREYFHRGKREFLWRHINIENLIHKIRQVCNGKEQSDVALLCWTLLEVLDEMLAKFHKGECPSRGDSNATMANNMS